jgi:hypothetical protein
MTLFPYTTLFRSVSPLMSTDFSQRYDCSVSTSFSSKLRGNCPRIIIIIIIITPVITFMQGIYNYIPETNHVSRVYLVVAVLYLQFVLHAMLFRP